MQLVKQRAANLSEVGLRHIFDNPNLNKARQQVQALIGMATFPAIGAFIGSVGGGFVAAALALPPLAPLVIGATIFAAIGAKIGHDCEVSRISGALRHNVEALAERELPATASDAQIEAFVAANFFRALRAGARDLERRA